MGALLVIPLDLLLAAAILVVLILPTVVLAIEVLASVGAGREELAQPHAGSMAVIVPAHNEERAIRATVEHLKPQLATSDRLIVVAHNCLDETASRAAAAGAEVAACDDRERVGKGYALAAGVTHLRSGPEPAVVVVVDADCRLAPDALSHLRSECLVAHAPIQGMYRMASNGTRDPARRIGEFAWRIKNELRPTGLARLGLPCQLNGSGMAFPFDLLSEMQLASAHVTEDLLLGVTLALAGFPARFCRSALVTSEFPETASGQSAQRRRWIHGHLSTVVAFAPKLLFGALRRRDHRLLVLALDLSVLPLVLQGMACVAAIALAFAWAVASGHWAGFYLSAVGLALYLCTLGVAWRLCGTDLIGVAELFALPRFAARSVRSAWALVVGRRSAWVRAER